MTRKMILGKFTVISVLVIMIGAGFSVIAEENNPPAPNRDAELAVDPMGMKLVRGLTNAGTGWGEVFRQPIRAFQNDNPYLALPLGLARGITMTVVRTMAGVLETAFFYIPFDGTYGPMLEPAYVWGPEPVEEEEEEE